MDFLRPASWEEALAAKAEHPTAVPIAGGTDVMVEINFDHRRPEYLMDLGRIGDLTEWEVGETSVRLGASVPYTRIMEDLGTELPGLALASHTVPVPAGTAPMAYVKIPAATTATADRCQWAGNAAAVAAMPARAPTTVPRLKHPCRVGRTGLPVIRSTSAPSTLIATSPAPAPTPNRHSPAVTSGAEARALPAPTTATLATISSVPTAVTGLVPNRDTRRPEQRMPVIEPTDRPNSTSPICAVDTPSRSRMSGVRVTHEDMAMPLRKKKRYSARRRR